MHVVAPEELRSVALDRVGRCPLPVGGRPRHHRLALGEGVLLLGQPTRPGQLTAHPPRVGDLGRPDRSEHQRGELAHTEAVLGRPGAHDLTPGRGVDAVTLAATRGVSDGLTPAVPYLDACCH